MVKLNSPAHTVTTSPPLPLPPLQTLSVPLGIPKRQVTEQVAKSTGGNYPNANAIVDSIKFGLSSSKAVSA